MKHRKKNTVWRGEPLSQADKALVLLHGRGSSPGDILSLTRYLDTTGFALAAPAATGNTWYPTSFLAPEAQNQPWLDSALALVHATLDEIETAGIPADNLYVLGFSQGACLGLEAVARRPKSYGGVFALSGGLIGLGANQRTYLGSLLDTPIFQGCSDIDPHIPKDRVIESAATLRVLGATVTDVLFGHSVNEDEIEHVRRGLAGA